MPTGVVKWYDPEGGIGIITPDGPHLAVWAEGRAVRDNRALHSGDRVQFDIWRDASGLWANNIHRIDGVSPASPRM
ncbi:cold shock domain-containing protein (plasmid) [Streptomyces scopuliridis]|uniref:Cold shock domain-containing protein n=1 Tax=Streptomyces scopuliridis TaxID=452529 RepID=A0ACD4ZZ02_9ACTN|nr:cold shock domain-containing protein [Streptomyces scopuliridis]WSB39294.1 cold shock domain-containing protein [Streptomyces scopuliridis]WSC03543.1 cold shock domain-containing protein [Streptomyces scopuliridis]WSC11313.1 cold shock domain-containing protein [Streptomyces scopuliridis]